jgi:hypothetical protein
VPVTLTLSTSMLMSGWDKRSTDEPHAMSYLERAYEEHNLAVLFIRTAPDLDSIRSSPRFRELVRRIGFPQH